MTTPQRERKSAVGPCTCSPGQCICAAVADQQLRTVVKNGIHHLTDGTDEVFYPTGEDPEEDDVDDAVVDDGQVFTPPSDHS